MTITATNTHAIEWLAEQGAHFALPRGRTKGAFDEGWPNTPHTAAEAAVHAAKGGNVGLLTGKHSANIVALDIDVEYPAALTLVGDYANTAKVIRDNAPERGKLLYRVKGELPPIAGWKPEGLPHNAPNHREMLTTKRHALIAPSIYEGGRYQLVDTELGIMEVTPDQLDGIWYTLTGEHLYKELAQLPAPSAPERKVAAAAPKVDATQYNAQVKAAWQTLDVFAHFGKDVSAVVKSGKELRLPGNGGLTVTHDGEWYCHAEGHGGNTIEAWYWCKHSKPWPKGAGDKLYIEVIKDMAAAKGIAPLQLATKTKQKPTGTANGYHPEQTTGSQVAGIAPGKGTQDKSYFITQGADDEGNAQCLHRLYPNRFLYTEAYGWLVNTGTHWEANHGEKALERAIVDTLMQRRLAAVAAEREDIIKVAKRDDRRVRATKFMYSSIRDVLANASDFDNVPYLLNCANGVVDLRTGKLSPHGADNRFTYCLPTEYDPEADTSGWVDFLHKVTPAPGMVDYLQQCVGYSITGDTREECLFYLHGPARSGKGTFSNAILSMLGYPAGPLAKATTFDTFTAQREGDNQNFDLAPLKACRFVSASEGKQHARMNEAKVKTITGNDPITAAFKHKNAFTYTPQFKIWLASNHPINADVDDDAFWYRVRVIEFPNSMMGKEDKELKLRMVEPENRAAVLAWAVAGAVKWYAARSLTTPAAVAQATQHQRDDMDYVAQWMTECCTRRGGWAPSKMLYTSYEKWCGENGVNAKKLRGFILSLKSKGIVEGKVRRDEVGVQFRSMEGIKLL